MTMSKAAGTPDYNLRLYVAGQTPKSVAAIANLKKLCDRHLAGRYNVQVIDLMKDPAIEVFWVTKQLHDAGMDLLARRRDKTYSLCDAVSFLLMRDQGITEALTTDHHFEQEGFTRLLK